MALALAHPNLNWFSYVQDFDLAFAEDWIGRLIPAGGRVLDPFAGTGTTLLAARNLGYSSVGVELSPHMVQMARARLDWRVNETSVRRHTQEIADALSRGRRHPGTDSFFDGDPLMLNWINSNAVSDVLTAVGHASKVRRVGERRFLLAAIAASLPAISNMEYRPNISYKKRPSTARLADGLTQQVDDMLADLQQAAQVVPDPAPVRVVGGDARRLYQLTYRDAPFDVVFSSPPYPNDMEYVHQTRLELQLFGYARAKAGLRLLKQQMITSSVKLVYKANRWQFKEGLDVPGVAPIVAALEESLRGRNWGWDAAEMVAEYFGGMRRVLRATHRLLRPGGRAAWVIGDSAFNGVHVPTNQLFANAARSVGFEIEAIETFRPRWNTKHSTALTEAVVIARR